MGNFLRVIHLFLKNCKTYVCTVQSLKMVLTKVFVCFENENQSYILLQKQHNSNNLIKNTGRCVIKYF